MKTIRLHPGAGRRVRAGHLWIFSNEIQGFDKTIPAGEDVLVEDHRGRLLGTGTFSPRSLIAVRLHAQGASRELDAELLGERTHQAWGCRKRWLGEKGSLACRVVNAEGDFLPGLVVDRFNEYLSIQCLTAAIERRTPWILDALEGVISPKGILLRNDSPVRALEGLSQFVSAGRGEVPSKVWFELGELRINADLWKGQKTGFFFDQRENYRILEPLCQGGRVLDGFSYTGIWGMHAARWGADEVLCADSSGEALELARENAVANRLDHIQFRQVDVLDLLKEEAEGGKGFDVIVLDPPAFARSRHKVKEALKGYINLNKWAMACIHPGGHLITCSCSYHVVPERFIEAISLSAREAGRRVRILRQGSQAVDHPWIPSMPETAYLKVLLLQVG